MKKIRIFAGILLVVLMLFPCVVLAEGGVPDEVLDARASLVRVSTVYKDNSYIIEGWGTGFAVGSAEPIEYIVTNYHVVEGNPEVIKVYQSEKIYSEATIYRDSVYADLAILKLDDPIYDLAPITIEDYKEPMAGDDIYALGYPGAGDVVVNELAFGIDGATVTDGIISAIKKGPLDDNNIDVEVIQVNASLNSGNSGGPLMNSDGHVVGINTFTITGASNVNGSINVSELITLLDLSGVEYLSSADKAEAQAKAEADAEKQAAEEAAAAKAKAEADAAEEADKQSRFMWLIVVLALALAVIGVLVFLLLRKRNTQVVRSAESGLKKKALQGMAFDTYFMSNRMTTDEKLFALLPLVKQVQKLHSQNKYNLDICPRHITVENNTASLRVKSSADTDGDVVRPGFSGIESYAQGKMKGPWTDVYALSAVLYTILEGNAPPAAFERDAAQPVFVQRARGKYQPLVETVEKGLAVQPEQRSTTVDQIIMQIQSILASYRMRNAAPPSASPVPKAAVPPSIAAKASAATGVAAKPSATRLGARAQKKTGSKPSPFERKAVAIPTIALSALILIVGALLIYIEASYSSAVSFADSGDYDKAEDSMQNVFMSYKESEQLEDYLKAMAYIEDARYKRAASAFEALGEFRDAQEKLSEAQYQMANELIEEGQYHDAAAVLEDLGDYQDADKMVKEVQYQEAQQLLADGEPEQAKMLLNKLRDYKDSDDLLIQADLLLAQVWIDEGEYSKASVLIAALIDKGNKDALELSDEISYQKAKVAYNDGQLLDALQAFEDLNGYKDSEKIINTVMDDVYNKGVEELDSEEIQKAIKTFSKIPDHKDAKEMIAFGEALMLAGTLDFTSEHYEVLAQHADYEKFGEYMTKKGALIFFLEGKWKDSSGGYFKVEEDEDELSISTSLSWYSGSYYSTSNGIINSVKKDGTSQENFLITYVNYNTIEIYNFKNQRTYSMTRQ